MAHVLIPSSSLVNLRPNDNGAAYCYPRRLVDSGEVDVYKWVKLDMTNRDGTIAQV
jgi:hypothetical protein